MILKVNVKNLLLNGTMKKTLFYHLKSPQEVIKKFGGSVLCAGIRIWHPYIIEYTIIVAVRNALSEVRPPFRSRRCFFT